VRSGFRAGLAARSAGRDHDGDAALADHPAIHARRHPDAREGIPQKSGGRIKVTLASWPERNLTGPELLRVIRSGQIDIGAPALPTVAGDVPLLDVADLAGLNPSHVQSRKVIDAMVPEFNKELERFGVRLIATFPYPAQVFFCREPITSLADLKGRRVRTPGGSSNDFMQAIGAQPVAIGFPRSIRRSSAASSIARSPARPPATAPAGTR
jgi:TRAP-type C4-dicarboxylate transport system substrate-binding protein